eukprot:7831489-Alexandrium_andersonii.AAC.1
MSASLVGSEMCIRDSRPGDRGARRPAQQLRGAPARCPLRGPALWSSASAVSYTHLTLPTICSV